MLVSVIIPYYKSEKYIFKTVDSVIKQSYKNWEIIIVDDENSLHSKIVLNLIRLKNHKIKIFTNNSNKGVSFSRNVGIKKSKGKFIAFLDSDDYWKKNKLKKQVSFMVKNKAKASFTSYTCKDERGKFLYNVIAKKNLDYNFLLSQCPICCSSVVLKKSIAKNIYFKNLLTKEDYELWLRLSKKNIFYGMKNILTVFTSRKNSLSSKQFNKIFNAYYIYRVFNKKGLFKSLYFVLRLYLNAIIKKIL